MENDMMLRKNCNAKLHAGYDSRSVKKKKLLLVPERRQKAPDKNSQN